jgi:hypothetical protein
MKHVRAYSALAMAAAAFLAMTFGPAPLAGQGKGKGGGGKKGKTVEFKMPERGPIPRTADGQPDLNGVWMRPYTPDISASAANRTGAPLVFTEWGQKKWEEYDPAEGDYAGACLPFGLIRSIGAPHPMQVVQSKNWIAFLHEQNTWFTKVPTDGRPFPPDDQIDPTWFGTTRGRWEGDVLVMESKGFNGKTRLDTNGHPHSDQMTVRETWELMNKDQVYYTITINDPKTYKEPLFSQRVFTRDENAEVMEYSCEENNKSLWEGRIKPPDYDKWLK